MSRLGRWLMVGAFAASALTSCTDKNTTTNLNGPVVPSPLFDATNVIINPDFVNGAYWFPRYDISTSVGSGVIRPFLDIQNTPYEEGFNTDNDDFQYDQHRTSDTNKLPLNYVPVINGTPLGVPGREFVLDANESNKVPNPQFYIDQFKLYLCNDANAPTYTYESDFVTNSKCSLVYTIENNQSGQNGQPILAADSTKGSGNIFDYRILIPDSSFARAADDLGTKLCPYLPTQAGEDACGQYLILWTTMGDQDATSDWITDATYEEFATIIRPYITVDKTVDVYETVTHDWGLDKKVDDTDGPETIVLPPGGSQDVDYAIQVDYKGSTVTSASASGLITIAYPGQGGNGKKGTPVYVHSISDAITPGPFPPDDLTCTGPDGALTLPLTSDVQLDNGEAITCTWSAAGLNTGTVYENTVSVELASLTVYDYTAEISFASVPAENITQQYQTVDFVDIVPPPSGTETSLGSCTAPASGNAADDPDCTAATGIGLDAGPPPAFTYSVTVSDPGQCETTRVNEAKIVQLGYIDDATLTVNCYGLDVSKTVETSYTRTHKWSLKKSVDPDSWDLFDGESGISDYGIDVSYDGYTDNDWEVSGTITVKNTSAAVDVEISSVEDVIAGYGGTVTVDNCSMTIPGTLTHGSSFTCDYSTGKVDSPDSNPFGATNTATAKVDKPTTSSWSSDPESVVFGDPTTEIDKTVTIDDDVKGPLGSCTAGATPLCTPESGITFESGSFGYSATWTCGDDAGSHKNTVDLYGDDKQNPLDTDEATVVVNCWELSIEKTVAEHYTRDYDWNITKKADVSSITAPAGAPAGLFYPVNYTIGLDMTGYTDNYWKVDGTITITNPAPKDGTLTGVKDVVDPSISAKVTCPSLTVPANDKLECTYSTDPQDAADANPFGDMNTATATQQLYDYASDGTPTADGTTDHVATKAVSFGDPDAFEDQCVDVTDSYAGVLPNPPGTKPSACYTAGGQTHWDFTYSRDIYPAEYPDCQTSEIMNTVTYETEGPLSVETGSATWTVDLDIPCPSCTRTPGYWKTHNPTFWGGAPADPTWNLINSPLPLPGTTGNSELSPFATSTDGALYKISLASYPDGSYFDAMWTPPQSGNAYWSLAHHYIAAALNILSPQGAFFTSSQQAAFDAATAFFGAVTPSDWTDSYSSADVLGWKSILADFNESGEHACTLDPITAAWLNNF